MRCQGHSQLLEVGYMLAQKLGAEVPAETSYKIMRQLLGGLIGEALASLLVREPFLNAFRCLACVVFLF
eukprot:1161882-Pelagomonas_calceolata.AAC.8